MHLNGYEMAVVMFSMCVYLIFMNHFCAATVYVLKLVLIFFLKNVFRHLKLESNLNIQMKHVILQCNDSGRNYILFYICETDGLMHKYMNE